MKIVQVVLPLVPISGDVAYRCCGIWHAGPGLYPEMWLGGGFECRRHWNMEAPTEVGSVEGVSRSPEDFFLYFLLRNVAF